MDGATHCHLMIVADVVLRGANGIRERFCLRDAAAIVQHIENRAGASGVSNVGFGPVVSRRIKMAVATVACPEAI